MKTLEQPQLATEILYKVKDAELYHERLRGITEQVYGLHEIYGDPRHGCYRITFIGDDHVIKVPYNATGIAANEDEADWDRAGSRIPLAACHLIDSPIAPFGVKLLWMEKVTPVPGASTVRAYSEKFNYPGWVDGIDGYQVGYTAAGKLVCFDP